MKHAFLFHIAFRIGLISLVAFGTGWAAFSGHFLVPGLLLSALLISLIGNLLHYQNKVNQRIRYFFEAIRNEDFTQAFPLQKGDKILQQLNESLNEINRKIQQIRIENEQKEQYFRALIEHIGTGILTFDERGFVIHANSALKKMLGFGHFTHIHQLEKIDPALLHTLKQMQQHEQKLVSFTGKQGRVNVSIRAGSFKNNDRNLSLLTVQDINRELDEKELDSWLKLIRVLTHEIMNAIAPVTSLSESLGSYFQKEGQAIEPEAVDEKMINTTIRGLEVIKEQGKGLVAFVESYRKLTRLPKPEKKPVKVQELLEKVILLNPDGNFPSGLTVRMNTEPGNLEVLADEKLLMQVLINLVKNSREALAGNENGLIELLAGRNKNGETEICVKDNGPGIPRELLDEIFVPFFTTRENGSGIGLSLSRQIMRLHGGRLKVHSVPGKETIFCMVF
ncbi:sensor histidine kinase [Gaoshiqia sp. Z1-71]|uniref:sensor histidine kinase n=1 Tax=Gaoshiqia hydrogeniformans TaxID=3290090 RepID=UPI003BF83F2D